MGQLRSATRALLLQAKSPAEALSALDDFARLIPGAACTTAFCAIVDRAAGVVHYSSAGHPPGILAHADGSTELLVGARSVPLASVPVGSRPEGTVRLRTGSTLLLYTDGLVERRTELIDVGISRVAQTLGEGGALPGELLADHLLRTHRSDAHRDDVALLLYRRTEPAPFDVVLPARPDALASTRDALRSWLTGLDLDRSDVEDVLIAAGEACANAIEHGYRFSSGAEIVVRGWLAGDRLHLLIQDTGGWREATANDANDRGWGSTIMARLMDEVSIDGTQRGTTVRLTKYLDRS